MASRSLGSLTLDLIAKTGGFTAGMTAAERQANKSLSAIEKRAYAFGRVLGNALKIGATAAVAGIGALSIAIDKAIDNADAIRDLSIRIGIGTEALSGYAYAAKQTGTDIEGLGRGLKILAKNAAEAADATSGKGKLFEALGVNVKDAAGNLKQLDVLLPEVADKFKELEDGTTKAALAQELFGKSGLELTEFLNQGADGLDAMAKKAAALGIIISQDTADAADEFNDQLGDLKAAAAGLSTQIAAELLPRLIELVKGVNEFVADGGNAIKIADGIGKTFDVLAGIWGVASKTIDVVNAGFGTMIALMASATSVAQGLIRLDFSQIGKGLAGGLAAIQAGAAFATGGGANSSGPKKFKEKADPRFAVTAKVLGRKTLQEQLAELFNGTDKGTKSGGGSKTPASEKIDKIKESYDRLSASMAEQIALFGQTTEVAQLRYDLENTELSKLTQAQKDSLLLQAEKIDAMNLEKELGDAAADRLKKETEAIDEHNKSVGEFIENLRFEGELIPLNNLAREQAIALRYANVDAMSEEGKEISGLIEKNMQLEESYSFIRDAQEGLSDAFADFVTGAKSAKEAFGDFADELFKRALQFVADKAIEALFKAFSGGGDSAGGKTGGGFDWTSLLSMFGGGKAGGGAVNAGMFYRVNERGPELLTAGGKDYLMMGNQSGSITPNSGLGGGITQYNQFIVGPQNNQVTQEQIASKTAFTLNEVRRRNG